MSERPESPRELIDKAREIKTIAEEVCRQAHNAEMHAQNAMAYAETARGDANDIIQIAESVTKAARAAAVLVLECTSTVTEKNKHLEELVQIANMQVQQIAPELVAKSERGSGNLQKTEFCLNDPSVRYKGRRHSIESDSGIIIRNSLISTPKSHTTERKSHNDTEIKTISDSSGGLLGEYGSMATVWEDSIQSSTETKPTTWAEKKTIRKIQRKLKNLDANCLEDVDDSDFETQKERDMCSKECLIANTTVTDTDNIAD